MQRVAATNGPAVNTSLVKVISALRMIVREAHTRPCFIPQCLILSSRPLQHDLTRRSMTDE